MSRNLDVIRGTYEIKWLPLSLIHKIERVRLVPTSRPASRIPPRCRSRGRIRLLADVIVNRIAAPPHDTFPTKSPSFRAEEIKSVTLRVLETSGAGRIQRLSHGLAEGFDLDWF